MMMVVIAVITVILVTAVVPVHATDTRVAALMSGCDYLLTTTLKIPSSALFLELRLSTQFSYAVM